MTPWFVLPDWLLHHLAMSISTWPSGDARSSTHAPSCTTPWHSWQVHLTCALHSHLHFSNLLFVYLFAMLGTYSAAKAAFFKRDLSVWTSFKVSNSEMDNAWGKIWNSDCFSFLGALVSYMALKAK